MHVGLWTALAVCHQLGTFVWPGQVILKSTLYNQGKHNEGSKDGTNGKTVWLVAGWGVEEEAKVMRVMKSE